MEKSDRKSLIVSIALVLVSLSFLSVLLGHPFHTRGEAREALVVQAMEKQQNLILPLRNGVDIPSKPPLFHWTAYAAAMLLGVDESATRAPSAIACSLALAFFYFAFSRRKAEFTALLGVLALGSSLAWITTATVARVDMMFALWASTATWLLFECSCPNPRIRSALLGAGIAMGLATLTKGPAGIALPVVVWGIYLLLTRQVSKLPVGAGLIAVSLAIVFSGWWYLAAYHQGGQRFLDVQIFRENMARVFGDKTHTVGHEGAPFLILPMFCAGLVPWSFFFPVLGASLYRIRHTLFSPERAGELFCIVWVAVYLVFFAFTSSKRIVYLLPCYPAVAYLFLGLKEEKLHTYPRAFAFTKLLCSSFVSLLFLALFFLLDIRHFDERPLLLSLGVREHDINTLLELTSVNFFALLGICASLGLYAYGLWLCFRERVGPLTLAFSLGTFILVPSASLGILSVVTQQQSPKHHLEPFRDKIGPDPVAQFEDDFYAVDYYLGSYVPKVYSREELLRSGAKHVFTSERDMEIAKSTLGPCEVELMSELDILYGKSRLVLLKCL